MTPNFLRVTVEKAEEQFVSVCVCVTSETWLLCLSFCASPVHRQDPLHSISHPLPVVTHLVWPFLEYNVQFSDTTGNTRTEGNFLVMLETVLLLQSQ